MSDLSIKQKIRYSTLYHHLALLLQNPYGQLIRKDLAFYKSIFKDMKIKTIFDVGANDGVKTKTFFNFAEHVVAFEPDPSMACILRYRFKENFFFNVEEIALGSEPNEAFFYRKKYSGYSTLSEKWSHLSDKNGILTTDKISVKINCLENMIQKYGSPHYIKIDVEGYENNVLKGLKTEVPIISFEANLPQFQNETIENLILINTIFKKSYFNFRLGDDCNLALAENILMDNMIQLIKNFSDSTIDIFAFSFRGSKKTEPNCSSRS